MDKIITTQEAKKRIRQGKAVYAVLKRKYDSGIYYGKDMLQVDSFPSELKLFPNDDDKHFYIKERVFYGAGLLERKISNYYFVIWR